jgi:hypothetical protein
MSFAQKETERRKTLSLATHDCRQIPRPRFMTGFQAKMIRQHKANNKGKDKAKTITKEP